MRFLLLLFCGVSLCTAQLLQTVEVLPLAISPRIAKVNVTFKQQTKKLWTVTLDNTSNLPIQVALSKITVNPATPSQLTKNQINSQDDNSFWSIFARTGQALVGIAPGILAAAGETTRTPSYIWVGVGTSVVLYFVARAQGRIPTKTDDIPSVIPLPPYGGDTWLLHTAKTPKNSPPVHFQIQVVVQ